MQRQKHIKCSDSASRTPQRLSPIGIQDVRLLAIQGTALIIEGLDAIDGTPLPDIKPYVRGLDCCREDANYGWLDDLDGNKEHLLLHIRGIPHDY